MLTTLRTLAPAYYGYHPTSGRAGHDYGLPSHDDAYYLQATQGIGHAGHGYGDASHDGAYYSLWPLQE